MWFSEFGPINRLGIFGRKTGFFTAIWRSCEHQNCTCHIGVIKIKFPWSIDTFFKTGPISETGGKAQSVCDSMRSERHSCLCCKGLVPTTCKLELGEILETQKDPNLGFSPITTFLKYFWVQLRLVWMLYVLWLKVWFLVQCP